MSNLLLVRNEAKKLGLTNEQIGRFLGRMAQGQVIDAEVDFSKTITVQTEGEDGQLEIWQSTQPLAVQTLRPYERVYRCNMTNEYWFFGESSIHKSVAQVLRDFAHSEGQLVVEG